MKARSPWRLAAQIYGLSLLTLLVAAAAVFVLHKASRPSPRFPRIFDHFAHEVAIHARDPVALQAAVDRLHDRMEDHVALYTWDGQRVVATEGNDLTPLSPDAAAALRRGDPPAPGDDPRPLVAVDLDLPGTFSGYALLRPGHAPPPGPGLAPFALVLGILGLASVIIAWRLADPLGRLVTTAQKFGNGDVRVRVALPPRGPLGQLGAVFDEMASRVARLLQAQRELLANVSHELRTPLSRLRVALELAADSDGATIRSELQAAEEDLAQLERMVEDVLRVASLDLAALQPEGSQPAARHHRLDLAALAARTARRFAVACPDRPVDVTAPEDPLWVDADPELVRRALDNLLDNARKYSEPTAPITVDVAADAAHAVITVADRGLGIDPADQPHVFTPFFRADRSRTRVTGGVGLGLTLVQRIVAAHGGSVALTSAPGQGTRVTLKIPREPAPQPTLATTREP